MSETNAKYHHLIPRTYMQAWTHGNGTLYIEYKNEPGIFKERNKNGIAGVNHYHSIIAGMPICTKDDTGIIFQAVKDYTVKYKGEKVLDTLELNKIYYDFNNWEILRSDCSVVSKKSIKAAIDNVKIRDIETMWAKKYEDKWNEERQKIEDIILSAKGDSIPEFDKDFLMKFYVSMDWRSFASNQQFNQVYGMLSERILELDKVIIPEDDRELPIFKTMADYFQHCILLKSYREFLEDKGMIYQNAVASLNHTSFHFLVADGEITFITSDNPAFMFRRKDGLLQAVLPITPRIMIVQGKNSDQDKNYYITHISDDAVKAYNRIIKRNSHDFVIIDDYQIEHF